MLTQSSVARQGLKQVKLNGAPTGVCLTLMVRAGYCLGVHDKPDLMIVEVSGYGYPGAKLKAL